MVVYLIGSGVKIIVTKFHDIFLHNGQCRFRMTKIGV